MPAWLRVLVALPKYPGLSPSIQMAVRNRISHTDIHADKAPYT